MGQVVGDWQFTSLTADFRRYDRIVGPITLATRGLFFGRMGRDERRFRFYGGSTELIRGYTAGSFQRHECLTPTAQDTLSVTGCSAFDQLVGTRVGVFNAELRVPLGYSGLGFLPRGFPAIEAALFYDAGVVWEDGDQVKLSRDPLTCPEGSTTCRTPLQSIGFGVRANVLGFVILRLDYSVPQNRPGVGGYWTISLGPAF